MARGGCLTPSAALALQRTAGNRAVAGLAGRTLAREDGGGSLTPTSGPSSASLRPPAPRTATAALLGEELAEKLEAIAANASLSSTTTSGHDMRFSLNRESEMQLGAGFSLTSRYQLSPAQLRLQWGQLTEGHRIDSSSGLRFGNRNWAVEALVRNTYASGEIAPVENQTVGALRLTLFGHFDFEYYNDHRFVFWPASIMPRGQAGDEGDTAGVNIGLNRLNQRLFETPWVLEGVGAHLRLATGIPDRNKTKEVGGRTFYEDVAFNQINQGVLSLSADFTNPSQGLGVRVEAGWNDDRIRNATQNRAVHVPLGIPEFEPRPMAGPFFSLGVTKSF